jgi:hypothetical protein
MHSMVLLSDEDQAKAHFGPLEHSANLDARQVHGFTEHTIGSKIVLLTPDETPR